MRTIALLVAWPLAVSPASADDVDDELRKCAKIRTSNERLACFDKLTILRASKPDFKQDNHRNAQPQDKGQWQVQERISRLDDSKNVYVSLQALAAVPDGFGRKRRPSLHVNCRENTTNVYIHFDDLFMSDIQGFGDITYRLDTLAPKKKKLRASTNHKSLGLWSGSQAIPFVKQLFGKDVLLVRATPYNENSLTFEFPISGAETAIEPLRHACGW